jgi:hypothetical protein
MPASRRIAPQRVSEGHRRSKIKLRVRIRFRHLLAWSIYKEPSTNSCLPQYTFTSGRIPEHPQKNALNRLDRVDSKNKG